MLNLVRSFLTPARQAEAGVSGVEYSDEVRVAFR